MDLSPPPTQFHSPLEREIEKASHVSTPGWGKWPQGLPCPPHHHLRTRTGIQALPGAREGRIKESSGVCGRQGLDGCLQKEEEGQEGRRPWRRAEGGADLGGTREATGGGCRQDPSRIPSPQGPRRL